MSITGDVTSYFASRDGETCTIKQMSNDLGYTEQQIRACISNKTHHSKEWASHLTVYVRGQVYKWRSEPVLVPKTTDEKSNLYEQIGVTKNGDLILQDEEGNLFRASELA